MKSKFFTRAKANEGIKLELRLPDGTPTECWIRVRGIDSDAYKKAVADMRLRALSLMGSDNEEDKAKLKDMSKGELHDDELLGMFVALVADWYLLDEEDKPIPCTPENIKEFLREAPQIAEQINEISTRRKLFFGKSLKSSTPTQEPSSSSTSPSPEVNQTSASESS